MSNINKSSFSGAVEEEDRHHECSSDVAEREDQICIVNEPSETYIMYKRRWIGMFTICILNISTGFVWLTFNAVPEITSKWLNTDLTQTNLSVILYFAGSIVASSFSGYVFEKWGIKRALILGGLINVVGTFLRYAASFIESSEESNGGRMTLILVGQFIAATAQPFFLNAPPKYAAVWFSDSSRAIATTIGSMSNPLAAAISMVVIPLICKDESDVQFTLLFVGIIAAVSFLPTLITPATPPTPPSASALIALAEAADEPFWISIKKVSKIKSFWVLFIAFSVYVALFNSFSSLINQIVNPYGYSDDDGGIFAACLILAGIPGAGVSGAFVDRTKNYRLVLRVCAPILAICYIAFIFVIREDFYIAICCVSGILGIFSFALLPVALESGIECTYPLPPSSSTSTLWMGGQFFAVLFLVGGDSLRAGINADPPEHMKNALITAAGLAVATSAFSFLYNSPNYRLEAEESKRKEKQFAPENQI